MSRLKQEIWDKIVSEAKEDGISPSEKMREILTGYFEEKELCSNWEDIQDFVERA